MDHQYGKNNLLGQKERWKTYTAIDLVLLMLGLLLDHQQRMIKEIDQQVAGVPLRTSAFV